MPAKPERTLARSFFEAAARLYRASPWRVLSDADPLRLDFDGFDDPMYTVIMGAGKETHGVALYMDGEQLIGIYESAHSTAAEVIAVIFATESETPADWNDMRRRQQLPVAGPAAIPIPVRHFADNTSRWPDARELSLLTAALDAVVTFVEAHTSEIAAGTSCAAMVQLPPAAGQATIRISFPAIFEGYHAARVGSVQQSESTPAEVGPRSAPLAAFRDRVLTAPGADRIMRRLAWSFFRAPGPPPGPGPAQDSEHALARFIEWGVFCEPLPPDNLTLAERALDADEPGLTADERAERRRSIRPRWSLFEVLHVEPGSGMDVRDLFVGDRLRLRERAGTQDLGPGHTIIGPLFRLPDTDDWILGGGITAWADAPRISNDGELIEAHEIAAIIEERMLGASTAWIGNLDERQLRSVWADFRAAFAATGTRLPAFGRLQDWIRLARTPLDVLRRMPDVAWWNAHEVDVFMAQIGRTWNLAPRRGRNADSSDQTVARLDIGPQELHLASLMLHEIGSRLNVAAEGSSYADLRERFDKLTHDWCATPRPGLDDHTPAEVIAREREIRSRPSD